MFNEFKLVILFLLVILCFFISEKSLIAQQANKSPIKIGMSTVLSGTAEELGQDMKNGIETYFAKINASGGINGRKLILIARDDKYEPTLTAENMQKLIDVDKVLGIIGNVGTPTAIAAIPIANKNKILLFGAFTGSEVLRKTPPDRYVINFRASYAEEMAAIINGLLSINIKPNQLAFFTQNDAFGDSGYQGAMKALKKAGYNNPEDLPLGRYNRNTLNVEAGLAQLLSFKTKIKAIIIVGYYAPVAKFIHLAKKEFPNTLFINISFIGSNPLIRALGKEEKGIIVTQVVPPLNADLPALQEYNVDMKKYNPKALNGFGSLEGYLVAKLFVKGLQQAALENKLTRDGIIDVFENMHNVDIGIGMPISLDKNHHQALHSVWPTIIKNGKFEMLKWTELK